MKFYVSALEILEPRIAPATLTGQALTYTDLDGDHVTVTISKGALLPTDFTFNTGGVTGDNSTPQQLQLINLALATGVDGADITVKVQKAPTGDGLAAVGRITAGLHSLGNIKIAGDLADLDCGPLAGTVAVGAVSVHSIGQFGATTEPAGSDEEWSIVGAMGSLTVARDVRDAWIHVTGGGSLGPVTIGGSLLGGSLAHSGSITTAGSIGPVKIGKDMRASGGDETGKIDVSGDMVSLTVGGSIRGALNHSNTMTDGDSVTHSGQVFVKGGLGKIMVAGSMTAGSLTSGAIFVHGNITGPVTIGAISSELNSGGNIGAIKLLHASDAQINAAGNLTSVTANGPFKGTIQTSAGGNIGAVKIAGDFSGQLISAGSLGAATVGGSVLDFSTITSQGDMGNLNVHGDLRGLTLTGSAGGGNVIVGGSITESIGNVPPVITFGGPIGRFSVKGSCEGTFTSGGLTSGNLGSSPGMDWTVNGASGPIQVHGAFSGNLMVTGSLASLTIGGLASGTLHGAVIPKATFKAGLNASLSAPTVGAVTIGGDFGGNLFSGSLGAATIGGTLLASISATTTIGKILVRGDVRAGGISADHLGSVTINGSVLAPSIDMVSTDGGFELLSITHDFGQLTVKGDVRGTVGLMGAVTRVFITAGGASAPTPTSDLAMGKITIGGSVERTQIIAGGFGTNPNAQIGTVKVGGDWIQSSLAAGVSNLGADNANGGTGANADNVNFGDTHDRLAAGSIAKIASITIGGQVIGSPASGDHFGFCAGAIGSFKAGGVVAKITPAKDAPIELAPLTGDVTLRET